ncbi:thermonuclease family protein [Gulbenkiania mobilis]|uniref:Endonuclease YncB(Thermonuclease family) n=1 Tax=Gulbenkiania mobilis TaxID=397457 RepID=A0ABY2D187_GULMO|nr:thermonuclease family protein [Gulbenkiania mobilis]TCW31510.1 endonuclease YncB(thermonuclease family) [Gulbenkiania mobilis]
MRLDWPLGRLLGRLILLGLLTGLGSCAADNALRGIVVGVADGDTITVLDLAQQQHRIRFAFIDAPEKAQPYGQKAKQALSDLVYRQAVRVETFEQDRYGRVVGRIWLGETDVNLRQIEQGLAWHYRAYAKNQPPVDYARYAAAELAARSQGIGLWQDKRPVAPWDYRRKKRERSQAQRALQEE